MISIIVAVAQNNVIGCANRLIWHISADLKRFKHLTTGHVVIMGRKTFDSIGSPLPNRTNVVVTHAKNLHVTGIKVVHSFEDAVKLFGSEQEVFVIGGGEIYKQAMDVADKLYVTEVAQTPDGDTFFPDIDPKKWEEVKRDERDGYSFVDYERKSAK